MIKDTKTCKPVIIKVVLRTMQSNVQPHTLHLTWPPENRDMLYFSTCADNKALTAMEISECTTSNFFRLCPCIC